ncbi:MULTISPECIES: SDR family NAD(P)-dependent oxidoreductase [Pseudonocardia]|uniref:NAD(P)-dependent dehydrogenase (Short-subunit alcohol dehydrogenase family) n=1 Tax=Pseudonocardia parietis TaxID=570936 RepID=A0ABS4VPC7_9PSEU|nr:MULTISPECIES: SDR family oxidoreductase [Pseudonocardia]MBP2365603.1 NAD(P)-dependent dehydrogenase (short-subunit alcohol dehydrogenase family) [Pseudonocardia parietis]MYW75389.1 SDR family oxidoreductase [Pseudonocardia sp. SID8383]OJG04667.1 Cyclopentanol dehydrogenase [Pseudonocardia autotrophica]
MGKLDGKNVVITGAAGGMGQAACRMFCEEGATVLGADLNGGAVKELESRLKAEGLDYRSAEVDVTSSASVAELAATAKNELGAVDVLYNNAGIIMGKPILETTEDEWADVERLNSKSIFLTTKAFVPLMAGRKGSIINVSSIGGVVAFENMGAYGAAKAAAAHFSRVAAVEFAPDIRVNAICPGVVDTPMPRNFTKDMSNRDEIFQAWNHEHLTGRLGRPEEVVSLALWLASDDAGFMTGAVLNIDGGYSTR